MGVGRGASHDASLIHWKVSAERPALLKKPVLDLRSNTNLISLPPGVSSLPSRSALQELWVTAESSFCELRLLGTRHRGLHMYPHRSGWHHRRLFHFPEADYLPRVNSQEVAELRWDPRSECGLPPSAISSFHPQALGEPSSHWLLTPAPPQVVTAAMRFNNTAASNFTSEEAENDDPASDRERRCPAQAGWTGNSGGWHQTNDFHTTCFCYHPISPGQWLVTTITVGGGGIF